MSAWYDQLAAIARAPAHGSQRIAFDAYRDMLAGSGVDAYREPMFDRVWVRAENIGVTFGLQFGDGTIEGSLHPDAAPPSEWGRARRLVLEEISRRLFDELERRKNPYHDFVAFAERVAVEGGGELTSWQREFAEQVERGNVDVTLAAGRRARKNWTAELMRLYEASRTQKDPCGFCEHARGRHELHPTGSGRMRGACTVPTCNCIAYSL